MADGATVLDNGSARVKAGLSFVGDDEPRAVAPTAVRRRVKHVSKEDPTAEDEKKVFDESLHRPIDRKVIRNWEQMEAIWHHLFYDELGWEMGEEGNLLVAEPLYEDKESRERLTQIMFEEFNVSGLFCAEQPVLCLYSVGKLTGCVVDVGHGTVDVTPIVEGQVYYPGVSRLPYGGVDLTALLSRRMQKRGIKLSESSLEFLKHKIMNCAPDDGSERKTMGATDSSPMDTELETHVLPDGQEIRVSKDDGLYLGEAFFNSSLLGLEMGNSIVVAANTAVQAFPDTQVRRQLAESVVFCGGGAEARGIRTRFQSEFQILAAAPGLLPSLVNPPEYMPQQTLEFASWMGGAILAKVVFQQNQHVTKFDYDESGPGVVHKKCT